MKIDVYSDEKSVIISYENLAELREILNTLLGGNDEALTDAFGDGVLEGITQVNDVLREHGFIYSTETGKILKTIPPDTDHKEIIDTERSSSVSTITLPYETSPNRAVWRFNGEGWNSYLERSKEVVKTFEDPRHDSIRKQGRSSESEERDPSTINPWERY